MSLEKPLSSASSQDLDPIKTLPAGERLEAQLFKRVECGWNGKEWIQVRKDNKTGAFKIFNEWAKANDIVLERGLDYREQREKIITWVKEHQPAGWKPGEPPILEFRERRGEDVRTVRSTAAADLHTLIAENLGIEDHKDLSFYTSSSTPLDTVYGIDGFFEWSGTRLTVDITKNNEKLESQRLTEDKADFIFTLHDVNDEGVFQKIPEEEIAGIARQIARSLKNNARAKKRVA